ncbi:MAG: cell division topological specificity factor MinE [Gammaproteobacteria bacterium 39-13]|nr:cell division topological specificity factor MinE [Gammaproteobacteria bacterium]OJV87822.1 MAG: cell division topological specificity factor MinE [Gammaproteobacteria bacterium 39-13]
MNIFNFFRLPSQKRSAAAVAKERLQIIVSHESTRKSGGSDIIKQLQKELIEVISKYVQVDQDLIKVQLERNGDHSVLELNVTLPDASSLNSSTVS